MKRGNDDEDHKEDEAAEKKQKISEELPVKFKNYIRATLNKQYSSDKIDDVVLLAEKALTKRDMNPQKGRFSFPSTSQIEDRAFHDDTVGRRFSQGIQMRFVEASVRHSTNTPVKLEAKKKKKNKNSILYVLGKNSNSWDQLVKRNNLAAGQIVQFWMVRVMRRPCCFALHRLREEGNNNIIQETKLDKWELIGFKNLIKGIFKKEDIDIGDGVLMIQKPLSNRDVNPQKGRFSFPSTSLIETHLRFLDEGKGMEIRLIDPPGFYYTMVQLKAKKKKKKNKKNRILYVLENISDSWNKLVAENDLEAGQTVQLWAFPVMGKLGCFALRNLTTEDGITMNDPANGNLDAADNSSSSSSASSASSSSSASSDE
ncbi:hypothetical protein ACH5RR_002622 [Cinchona calisaya]|uniref:B3 domain-containing protein n=1 Tax=Cinchona calisaya TaxID=153742 RepID=A0ABD3ASL2_9GENT